MKITFLGTGTSHGVPAIGCYCEVCCSSDPLNQRFRSSIYVQSDHCQFVVDTTPDFRSQCLRANISRLDAIIYTHEHSDHLLGLDELRRFRSSTGKRLPTYGSAKVLECIQRIFPYALENPPLYKGLPELDLYEIQGPFELKDLRLTPYWMPHGITQTLGFRFDTLRGPRFAYLTDCKEVSYSIRQDLRGIPLLILDALRKQPHPTHMTLDEALEVVREIRPERALFTHISHEMDHHSINAELPETIQLAYDGQVVEI